MFNSIVGALMLLAIVGGVNTKAQASPDETPQVNAAPQFQVHWLSGKIEIETPGQTESVAGQKMPYIRSGSIVRVISGSAEFESDYHATVRARNGDAFHFAVTKPESGRPGVLSIAAVEKNPQALEVNIGDQKFRLLKSGAVSIAATGQGEMTVTAEKGNVVMEPGSIAKDGTVRAKVHMMAPQEKIIVPVPDKLEFETESMNASEVNITRESDTAFVAQARWPIDPAKLNMEGEARRSIAQWPEASRTIAEVILEKYGPPNSVSADKLVWNNNGSWKRTTVYATPNNPTNMLEQTISYDVPQDKLIPLAEIDISLTSNHDEKELSASSDSEERNFLALNLGNEVLNGRRTPQEAQDFYVKTLSLANEGKSSPYTQGLLFQAPQ